MRRLASRQNPPARPHPIEASYASSGMIQLARLPEASAETREAIEVLSSAIVNKILHTPITKLRESRRAGLHRSWMDLVHELFGLGRHA